MKARTPSPESAYVMLEWVDTSAEGGLLVPNGTNEEPYKVIDGSLVDSLIGKEVLVTKEGLERAIHAHGHIFILPEDIYATVTLSEPASERRDPESCPSTSPQSTPASTEGASEG